MEKTYDARTTAALSQLAAANRADTNARRLLLEQRRRELDELERQTGPSGQIEALRQGLRDEHARLDEFSVGKATIHRVTVAYKAWLVFKPLIIWPLLAGLIPFVTLMLIAFVLRWTVSEEASALVVIAGTSLTGMLAGLAGLAGTVVAIIRLFSSRETLFTQLPAKVKPRFVRAS